MVSFFWPRAKGKELMFLVLLGRRIRKKQRSRSGFVRGVARLAFRVEELLKLMTGLASALVPPL